MQITIVRLSFPMKNRGSFGFYIHLPLTNTCKNTVVELLSNLNTVSMLCLLYLHCWRNFCLLNFQNSFDAILSVKNWESTTKLIMSKFTYQELNLDLIENDIVCLKNPMYYNCKPYKCSMILFFWIKRSAIRVNFNKTFCRKTSIFVHLV